MKHKILPHNEKKVKAEIIKKIENLKVKDGYVIDISKIEINRSLNQNQTYWLWIRIMAIEIHGRSDKYTNDLVHQELKKTLLEPIKVNSFGKEFLYYTTTILDTIGFSNYMENARQLFNDNYGIYLLFPDQYGFDKMVFEYADK